MTDPHTARCPSCGAALPESQNCMDYFYQLLYWENENPVNGEVHHLTVLGYYLQHPRLYSPDGLRHALGLLVDFVEKGIPPQEVRRRDRDKVASDRREIKITSRSGAQGAYAHPVQWTMTAADVVAAGEPRYRASVFAWASSILDDLRSSGNL